MKKTKEITNADEYTHIEAPNNANNKVNYVILKTISSRVIYIVLLFAVWLFWTGHNSPGGGFIAGLMTSGGLVLLYTTFGSKFLKESLYYDFKYLIPIGVGFVILCGMGAVVLGYPFLTHAFGHFNLPIFGEVELATATIFDLGVYVVVVGAVMTIITSIGESKDGEADASEN